MVQRTDTTPWYKQFWPWFLMAPLFMTVTLSTYMLYTAFTKADSVVSDNYYKEGLAINALMEDLETAKTLGIQAELQIDSHRVTLTLAAHDALPSQTLALRFSHPADSAHDQTIAMMSAGNGLYVAKMTPLTQGKWYLDITNSQGTLWRLKAEVHYPFERMTITP